MILEKDKTIDSTIEVLFREAKKDYIKMATAIPKGIFRPLEPGDFENVYLSISEEQGEDLVKIIANNNSKNIVEFGTSFGISTLYLAKGIQQTGGAIVTTELVESKAKKALENFKAAGVYGHIDLRVGDAMKTLKGHSDPIDLLVLDGWKDLYLPLFVMLEPCFHSNTIIYVDNADMKEVKLFLREVKHNSRYNLTSRYDGKVALIRSQV